jgi:hypothetical protein
MERIKPIEVFWPWEELAEAEAHTPNPFACAMYSIRFFIRSAINPFEPPQFYTSMDFTAGATAPRRDALGRKSDNRLPAKQPPEQRAKWSILCGQCGLRLLQWVYCMTASEANRQRVLTLLLVERAQTRAEFKKFYLEISSVNPGEWSSPEARQLSTVDHPY